MMVRTQITLNAERHALARTRADEIGISLAEYIRRLVDQDLAGPPRKVDRSIVFDLGMSSGTDIASDKDRMIGEAMSIGKSSLSD